MCILGLYTSSAKKTCNYNEQYLVKDSTMLDRADSSAICPEDRETAFAAFGITNTTLFARGTEAEVYERDDSTLLKLYAGTERHPYIETLRRLYDTLDTGDSGLTLPRILDIRTFGQTLAVIESRLAGRPLEDHLAQLSGTELEQAEDLYLDAACNLRHIHLDEQPTQYLLFDRTGHSSTSKESFASFYAGLLKTKLTQIRPFFEEVASFREKAAMLVATIRRQPSGPLSLIHGDFFPGNLLVNEDVTRVEGVIDFGSFSMFGHYALDVAGAFGYYKMYDPDRKAIRAALIPRILSRLPPADHAPFYQFVLANAILTCNLYAPEADPRSDGHFQWSKEILATQVYWDAAFTSS